MLKHQFHRIRLLKTHKLTHTKKYSILPTTSPDCQVTTLIADKCYAITTEIHLLEGTRKLTLYLPRQELHSFTSSFLPEKSLLCSTQCLSDSPSSMLT